MMPIVGIPIVERVLMPFIANGLSKYIIVANSNDQQLVSHLSKASIRLKIKIKIIFQENPLGTAHALNLAASYLHQDFFISACDNLVPTQHITDLLDSWNNNREINGILSLINVRNQKISSTALVEMNNNYIECIIEKPSLKQSRSNISSIPLYCFSPMILKYLTDVPLSKRGEYELQDAIQMLINQNGLIRGVFTKCRLTVTSPEDLLYVNKWFLYHSEHHIEKIPKYIDNQTKIKSPVHIEDGSIIGQSCSIGPNVFIESGSLIGDYVTIEDAMILQNARVQNQSTIKDKIVI
jgi:NDP-sugar pyrophosphorylase family protein